MLTPTLSWHCQPFDQISQADLYAILQLRNEVFVVEQNCVYQDCDGKDVMAFHLFAKQDAIIVSYARLLPPGCSFSEHASIGRVLVKAAYRNSGLGKELMRRSIRKTIELFGLQPIKIAAQVYLTHFYSGLGFKAEGLPFDEDGIPHIHMRLRV